MSDDDKLENKRRELIKRGEGCIAHMYLDTKGKVTVGVGNMLPSVEAAQKLPFINLKTGEPATAEEIEADFNAVAAQNMGMKASSYRQYTQLYLDDDSINKLLDRRIRGFEVGLKRNFPDYDNYPQASKLGLMDMAFNLGNSGLVDKFPSFTRAARAKDWQECAQQCKRKGISDKRNNEVKQLFASLPLKKNGSGMEALTA